MGFQFIHYEKYKLSEISNILGEARRDENCCPHVANPKEPITIRGNISLLEQKLNDEVPNFKREVMMHSHGKEVKSQRKLRKDANVLLAGVASYPDPNGKPGDPDFDRWQKLLMRFLEQEYGEQLHTVVLHLDESHPHFHFYVVPEGYDMGLTCRAERAAKENNKKSDFVQALKAYQDDYYTNVGIYCGMSRFGPKRQRMTRQEWKDEQVANKIASECINKTLQIAAKTKHKVKILQNQVNTLESEKNDLRHTVEEQEMIIGMTTGLGDAPLPKPSVAPRNESGPEPETPRPAPELGEFGL